MFQYTSTTILNSLEGKHKGNKCYAAIDGGFHIDGVGTFLKKYIHKIWKSKYQEAKAAELTVTVNTVEKGKTYRLMITLTQEGLVTSYFQNAMLRKNKPLFYEVTATSDVAADLVKKLEKVIKAENRMGLQLITPVVEGATLTLTATDYYTRFVENLCSFDLIESDGNNITGYKDYKPTDAEIKVTARGTEGVGTSYQMMKNHRIPTIENIDPFGADTAGKPVPGAKYDTYVIEYLTPRRHIGHQVMGAIDWSLTTHVIYLNNELTGEFDEWLTGKEEGSLNLDIEVEGLKYLYGDNPKITEFTDKDKVEGEDPKAKTVDTEISTLPDLILDDELETETDTETGA